ncbi:uncharacterized protein LOC106152785 [Lingula anatina]|uniref:Uncharacterized protein LOC106152785 n=1 Tax=Lingula anatina TaxID=7574 RepID=A0A1S3HA26_LINAN|nr:uncharacterized protein LOC106152785 [Lingula anatina]|eukprot:XP_013381969.1 uncharacterized protein LOC106152785 [Lingula anatina]
MEEGGAKVERSDSTVNLTIPRPRSQEAGRMIMVLVAVCAVIAIIAVIIAAVAVSRPSSPNITIQRDKTSGGSTSSQTSGGSSGSLSGSGRATNYAGQRIYTIAIGHDYGAHEYIDTSGYLAGFSHDVIDAVCTEAGLDCRTVWDKYINCWDSTPGQPSHGGQGT